MDEMKKIVLCKLCGRPEYNGEMRWLSGKCMCRDCYRDYYETQSGKPYEWNDLEGQRPTMKEYERQEEKESA